MLQTSSTPFSKSEPLNGPYDFYGSLSFKNPIQLTSQLAFTCSKSILETLEQCAKPGPS